MSSSDGFCSALSFASGELGSAYQGPPSSRAHRPSAISVVGSNSAISQSSAAESGASTVRGRSASGFASPSPMSSARPPSPTRSESASSVATQSSFAHPAGVVVSNPTPSVSKLPSVAATGSSALPSPTPPLTPLHNSSGQLISTGASFTSNVGASVSVVPAKRENETQDVEQETSVDGNEPKRRRIAPILVSGSAEKPTNQTEDQ